jgi:DNA replicative helicase MCM subunit Mcm2 (Cdc46/Mcm family)
MQRNLIPRFLNVFPTGVEIGALPEEKGYLTQYVDGPDWVRPPPPAVLRYEAIAQADPGLADAFQHEPRTTTLRAMDAAREFADLDADCAYSLVVGFELRDIPTTEEPITERTEPRLCAFTGTLLSASRKRWTLASAELHCEQCGQHHGAEVPLFAEHPPEIDPCDRCGAAASWILDGNASHYYRFQTIRVRRTGPGDRSSPPDEVIEVALLGDSVLDPDDGRFVEVYGIRNPGGMELYESAEPWALCTALDQSEET